MIFYKFIGVCSESYFKELRLRELREGGEYGSSGGKYSYSQAADKADADKKEIRRFEDYYVKIQSESQFDEGYTVPKVGATLTLTAVDNAFKKAAYYYYNAIMEGGNA